jgi:molybdopterin converting factor small subunit
MKARFLLEAQLRTAAGSAEQLVELPADSTLLQGIQLLAERLGEGCRGHLLTEIGEVRPSLLIVVNGESVYSEEAASFPLQEPCEILLMPPIAGG